MMDEFKEGQYIVYKNGNSYEIGKIKRVVNDGAFVYYSDGDTASKTPFGCMHEIINDYAIGETNLGGCTTPVRHGHWILIKPADIDHNITVECSVCGAGDTHAEGIKVPYCWKCGTKIDEVSE